MGKKRTKLEKMRAKLRNIQVTSTKIQTNSNIQFPTTKPEISLNKAAFYAPNLELPMEMLKVDLTKTLVVTILAIILQMSLAFYLNHGGWKMIDSLVISKLTGTS